MLLRLEPNDISKYWESIKRSLISASSQYSISNMDEVSVKIFSNLLKGLMQCWVGIRYNTPSLVLITSIETNFEGVRCLNIYSVYSAKLLEFNNWEEILHTLKLFAKENSCKKITALSKVGRIIEVAERLNFDTETRFIEFNLE